MKTILMIAAASTMIASAQAVDPAVKQSNIHETICTRGYTATVRPPRAYTSALKRKLMREQHISGPMSAYELDHWIPLEIGGAGYDPRNMWLEPIADAKTKDLIENRLHREVCGGRKSLATAQREMADWRKDRR